MSNWIHIKKVRFKDLDALRDVCLSLKCELLEEKGGEYAIVDRLNNGHAYLKKDDLTAQKGLYLYMDNDARYSPLARRLGQNLGTLVQDYNVEAVRRGLRRTRHVIRSVRDRDNKGRIVMRVAVH